MKGLSLVLCAALPAAASAEFISFYESPESLVRDFDRAISGVTSPEELRFNLAAYYSCRAREKGRIDVCDGLDSHLPATHENLPSCRRLFHQARMIEDSVGGTGEIRSCVELAMISEEGLPDADTRAEAADFCRKLGPLYEEGRPEAVCDFMFSQDGAYGENPYTGKPISRSDCIEENAFLAGEPAKCDVIVEGQGREHCRSKAALVRRVKDKDSGFQTDGPGCAALAETTIKRYEALRRRRWAYNSPERLVADFKAATQNIKPAEKLLYLLSDYFACVGLRKGSEQACDPIDALMPDRGNPTDFGGSHCREQYQQGLLIVEALNGLGSLAACLKSEEAEGDGPSDGIPYCKRLMAAYSKGNTDDICAVIHEEEDSPAERADRSRCRSHHLGLTGRPEACGRLSGYQELRCRGQARFVRSLKSGSAAVSLSTLYAPLVRRGASCSGPGRLALREYEAQRRRGRRPREYLSEYYACLSFREGSDARCGEIDKFAANGGDPNLVCDAIHKEDGHEDAADAASKKRCVDHHLGLAGDVRLCARLSNVIEREHCESQAALVRAVREGRPELAAATHFAPLVDPDSTCQAARRRARGGDLDSPESIAARHTGKARGVKSMRTLDLSLIEYFVCAAYQKNSSAPCENIDRHLPPVSEALHNCKALYQEGLMLKELAEGSGSTKDCELDDGVWPGAENEDAASSEICRKSIPYLVRGDLEGYCKMVVDSDDDDDDGRSSMEECRLEYIYFTGDREKCSLTPYNFGRQERCRYKADLLKAVRERKPRLVENTFYAPLLNPGSSCDGLKGNVIREYSAHKAGADR